jgi:hypothetical protein
LNRKISVSSHLKFDKRFTEDLSRRDVCCLPHIRGLALALMSVRNFPADSAKRRRPEGAAISLNSADPRSEVEQGPGVVTWGKHFPKALEAQELPSLTANKDCSRKLD